MASVPVRWELAVKFDAYSDDMAKAIISALCEGITLANMIWMAEAEGEVPCCLGEAGVRYIDPPGCSEAYPCQKVLSAPEILRRKVATCVDVACYYAALLRRRGEHGEVVVINTQDERGEMLAGHYHVVVETGTGIHDYTKDLIRKDNARCRADCGAGELR